jgi:hypothetical protein
MYTAASKAGVAIEAVAALSLNVAQKYAKQADQLRRTPSKNLTPRAPQRCRTQACPPAVVVSMLAHWSDSAQKPILRLSTCVIGKNAAI